MEKQYAQMTQRRAVDVLAKTIWSDGREMHDYPAVLMQRYLDGEMTVDVCVHYNPQQFVRVDMVYYIKRAAAFVRKAYGYERAEHAENRS
jgi:hypothetical protein